ncbi:PorT family protein [Rufibacter hautae]|uniref:PorT family protein n=1 Tax=Rufibacter hautae TaxID=2595005 RepID=A0A5B6TLM0_9BACT|nr:PorT family protein [Rufibacter hautae]KAA3440285.1 PorT family protein [Rufibacter hautae]
MLTDKEQEEIRRKMLGLEEEPPVGSWSKIAAEIRPPKKRRPLGWFFLAALLLLVVPGGVYYIMENKPETQLTQVAQQEQPKPQIEAEIPKSARKQTPSSTKSEARSSSVAPESRTASRTDEPVLRQITQNEPKTPGGETQNVKRSRRRVSIPVPVPAGKILVLVNPKDSIPQDTRSTREARNSSIAKDVRLVVKDSVKSSETAPVEGQAQVTVDTASTGVMVADSLQEPVTVDKQEVPKTDSSATAEEKKVKPGKPWFLGFTVAPRYAFRSFKPEAADEVYISKVASRKGLDTERMGYEFGLNFGKMLKRNLYLETSLSLMKLRENVSYSYSSGQIDSVVASTSPDGTQVLRPYYAVDERQLKSSFAYGGLRVGLTYFFLEKPRSRFNLSVAGGMNLLVKGRTQEFINGEWKETITFPSKENLLEQSNYNLLIGAGYNFMLFNKVEVMFMPSLNYFLGSTFKAREPFGLRPYTLGFNLQIRKRFND